MEVSSLSRGCSYGRDVSIRELCSALDRSFAFVGCRKSAGRPYRQQKIRNTLRKPERKDFVTDYNLVVSTVLEKNSRGIDKNQGQWRLDEEIERLRSLLKDLRNARNMSEKLRVLERDQRVRDAFQNSSQMPAIAYAARELNEHQLYLLKCLVASGQQRILRSWERAQPVSAQNDMLNTFNAVHDSVSAKDILRSTLGFVTQFVEGNGLHFDASRSKKRNRHKEELQQLMQNFTHVLDNIERFYDCIGGIIGYQLVSLERIRSSEMGVPAASQDFEKATYHFPEGKDLSEDVAFARQAAAWGLSGLSHLGEIYPLGGAGDRLGLVDERTGDCLPVAMLPYCGRTLLEGHIRDLQAREYLYFKVYGEQLVTPVAIMTSAAKKNHERVYDLLEAHKWFGRGKDQFKLFEQPLVPAVAADDGAWVLKGPLELVLKPGGHGVIWKLAKDKGIFRWFYSKGRESAIVRQISNPIAATDVTLLALAGTGLQHKKKFGFASCERNVGAAEGVNVLVESKTFNGRWRYCTSCIEYTEFSKLGISDVPISTGSMRAKFPANTNVLFVDLHSVEKIAASDGPACLPGMIMNLKKPVTYTDAEGNERSVRAGRLECTMQNVADFLYNESRCRLSSINQDELDTYVIFNKRRKVTSSAKRRRKPGDQSLHQTPDGSFLDITRNSYDLFTSCGVDMDEMEGSHCYIDTGPPFLVLFHPALGPLWDIIRQKIQGGSIRSGSEVQLEVAELLWRDVHVDGSLRIQAENVMGAVKQGVLNYGDKCGRCKLERVRVKNQGIDWKSESNVYWQNKVSRYESLEIILKGDSEFHASDVLLVGSHVFEVPDGHRMTITQDSQGGVCRKLEQLVRPWRWDYKQRDNGMIELEMV